MEAIFLTGATGNIGSRITADLLKKNKKLYLLIRGKNQEDSENRLKKIMDFWEVPKNKQKNAISLNGDITKNNLGLSPKEFKKISKEITHIIHCAANIKLILPLKEARNLHFNGTKNIIELAKTCKFLKRFNYLSTMEIAGNISGKISENFIKIKRNFLNTYEIAKSETEEYLQSEIKKGLPITIYRPSMVIGDSKTGKILKFSTFYYTLKESVINPKAGIVPASDNFYLDIIPVDFVSESICELYNSSKSKNKVYNIVAGKNNSLKFKNFVIFSSRKISEITKKPKTKIKFINPALIKPLLKIAWFFSFGKSKRKLKFQLIMINFLFLKQEFTNNRLRNDIPNIEIPNFKNYAENIFRYYFEKNIKQDHF